MNTKTEGFFKELLKNSASDSLQSGRTVSQNSFASLGLEVDRMCLTAFQSCQFKSVLKYLQGCSEWLGIESFRMVSTAVLESLNWFISKVMQMCWAVVKLP